MQPKKPITIKDLIGKKLIGYADYSDEQQLHFEGYTIIITGYSYDNETDNTLEAEMEYRIESNKLKSNDNDFGEWLTNKYKEGGKGMPNIKVVCKDITFDAKLENLAGKGEPRKIKNTKGEVKEIEMKPDGSPKLIRRTQDGKICEFARVNEEGNIVGQVANAYCTEDKEIHQEAELNVFYLASDGEEIPATKNDKTDVFELTSFEPIQNYLDKYQMEKYYQIIPSSGSSKKDVAKKIAISANTSGMKKLWDYLMKKEVVGRGILNITSAGWLPNVAYIRPVLVDKNKWTLEIAIFKQPKKFTWIEETKFKPVKVEVPKNQSVVLDI